jgi:hypothetical protein
VYAYADSEFPDNKNTMQRWGLYTATLKSMVKFIRDIPKNVFIVSLQKTDKDDVGRRFYGADISGSLQAKLPAFFDVVLNLKIMQKEGEDIRVIQTFSDAGITCKDRSNTLDRYEKPNLGNILKKIGGQTNAPKSNGKGSNIPKGKGQKEVPAKMQQAGAKSK